MRILVVNWLDRENPQAGGAEEHLHEVFGRLARWGHDVTALVSGWPGCDETAELDGMKVHRAGGRYTFSTAGPLYYHGVLEGERFDVVVDDLNKVPTFAPKWVEGPVVLLAHHLFGMTAFQAASPPVAAATWLLERMIPSIYRGTPAIAVSESTRSDLVARGLDAKDIEVVPNGVDVAEFVPEPEAKTDLPTLLFLGRLKQYKRVDLLIEAARLLADEGIDVAVRVGGTGDQSEALRALAARRGISDRVALLGYVPDDVKLQLLQSSWIHVLTSSKEGWGISVLEAGACATPSVASDSPGLRESVVHGETGLLVPHGDASAVAAAIRRLIVDPGLRSRMSEQARSFAETYSWDASARRVEAVLDRVVETSPPQ